MQARSCQAVELAQELAAVTASLQEADARSRQQQEMRAAELEQARDAASSRLAEVQERLQAEQKRVQALQHAAELHAQRYSGGLDGYFGMHPPANHPPQLAAAIERLAAAAEAAARERHAMQVLHACCARSFSVC